MKINLKVLSIPPYISTSWDQVSSLHMDKDSTTLIILLKNGKQVRIPDLQGNLLDEIFKVHADVLELTAANPFKPNFSNLGPSLSIGIAPTMQGVEGLESFTSMLQHDPAQKNAPPVPQEILDKIVNVSKALGMEGQAFNMPPAEAHCGCPYCQVARAMLGDKTGPLLPDLSKDSGDEPVSDADLSFKEWDITKIADKLYDVVKPFDPAQHFRVYLGKPIGCTCGKNDCEHVIAVLNS